MSTFNPSTPTPRPANSKESLFHRVAYPCDKIPEFAYDFLDAKLPLLTAWRFRLHLSGCHGCREYLKLYQMAADTQKFIVDNPLPPEMLESTLEFLKKEGVVEGETRSQ
jgi:hypothetical protein